MQKVPGHKGGIAVGKFILRPAGAGIQIARARARLADPAGVGLRRDDISDVLDAIEHVHRTVFDPVLVAGDQAAADLAVVGVLAGRIKIARGGIEPLDNLGADRGFLAKPDRRTQDQDFRGLDLFIDGRPVVLVPAVLGHIGIDAVGDVVIHGPHFINRDTVFFHNRL